MDMDSVTVTERPASRRASARFLLAHPAHFIALGFGSGLSPVAPGTAGTLWAWLAYLVMQAYCAPAAIGWIIAGSLLIGWWACMVTARNLHVADPGCIVWDEVAAFWVVLWLVLPAGFWAQLWAFALFRFFDAIKPGPIGWLDGRFKGFGPRGAFGILLDDLGAAFATLLVIAAFRAL